MSWSAIRALFSIELRKAFSYRLDFWVQFLGTVIVQVTVAWFLWGAVFRARGITELGGYTFPAMMFYYLLVPLVDRLNRGSDNFSLSNEIYDGSLTRYLLYPISIFTYRFIGTIARALISLVQLAIGVGGFALLFGLPSGFHFAAASIAQGFFLCALSVLCYFLLSTIIEMVAFWADNVWSLVVILRFVIQIAGGALIPLDLFPEGAQKFLMVTPFPHFIYVPVRLLMGQGNAVDFLFSASILTAWIVVFAVGSALVWRAGTREYSGVGI
jgi:ABC-2 type transport system permease protein